MSMSLSLYIVEPEKDDFHWIGRPSNLLHYLFYGQSGDTLRKHLSKNELDILQPTDWPEPAELMHKTKDARSLRPAIERVAAILQENESQFPRAHMIVSDDPAVPSRMDGSVHWKDESGRRWSLEAFHDSMEHREEVQVRVSNAQTESYWIPVKEVIELGGRSFRIHSQAWHELCRPDIDGALKVCDKAIQMNAPVLWAVS